MNRRIEWANASLGKACVSFGFLLFVFLPCVYSKEDFQISYVLQPFEHLQDLDFSPSNQASTLVSSDDDWLFGNNAVALTLMPNSRGRIEQVAPWDGQRHNCLGATHFSLWYKTSVSNCELSLSFLVPETPCNDANCAKNEYGFRVGAPLVPDQEWHELTWELHQGMSDHLNQLLDHLNQLLGWFIIVDRGEDSYPNERSPILLDHFACFGGGGDLLGAAFKTGSTGNSMFRREGWVLKTFQSDLSVNSSKIDLVNDQVVFDPYIVEQTDQWGGYFSLQQWALGYYNLSGSKTFSLPYNVMEPADTDRVHFRIILNDADGCEDYTDCGERYYTFHHSILPTKGSGVTNITLAGDDSFDLPFVFTGWSGSTQNKLLDLEHIKTIIYEISIDLEGEIGSTSTGAISFGPASVSDREEVSNVTRDCQEGETVSLNYLPSYFRSVPHERNCCERCAADDECSYAFSSGDSTGENCYISPYIGPGVLGFKSKVLAEARMFAVSRQDEFCDVCRCNIEMGLIDCNGRDLKTLPSTFRGSDLWAPRVLDLSNNPKLAYIGRYQLSPLAESLEELILPRNVEFLSQHAIEMLHKISVVRSEDTADGNLPHESGSGNDPATETHSNRIPEHSFALQNAIVGENGVFGHVCCERGVSIDLDPPFNRLYFCDMAKNDFESAGVDAEFLNFTKFQNGGTISVLRPNSLFMSEASDSHKTCAEYCSITPECRYFSFDQRISEAENRCELLRTNGSHSDTFCCNPEHYADRNRTMPGYISGWPASTRHERGASVLFSTKDLTAHFQNVYKAQYEVSLTTMPTRGAVWVTPTVASTGIYEVNISPSKVALYDNTTKYTVTVSVLNANQKEIGETIVLMNIVESCDKAFSSSLNDIELTTFLNVVRPGTTALMTSIFVPLSACLILLLLVCCFALERRKAIRAEALWEVKEVELVFPDEPHVLGRGTFGLVLLCTYRGTAVAVKRILPKELSNTSTSLSHGFDNRLSEVEEGGEVIEQGPTSLKPPGCTDTASLSRTQSVNVGNEVPAPQDSVQEVPVCQSPNLSFDRGLLSPLSWSRKHLQPRNKGSAHIDREGLLPTSFGRFGHIFPKSATDSELKARFREEMHHLAKLRHPCITTVLGAVVEKNCDLLLVMELMQNGSLYDILHNETMVLEGDILLPILRDVAQGLRFLHSASPGILHGDLKSRRQLAQQICHQPLTVPDDMHGEAQNILVDGKFRGKVADFGLTQKRTLGVSGTPYWLAPEILRKESKNTQMTDIYSFGIVLFEVYARQDPYVGEAFEEVLQQVCDPAIAKRPPVPIGCPAKIQTLMKDCLLDSPANRPTFEEIDLQLKRSCSTP